MLLRKKSGSGYTNNRKEKMGANAAILLDRDGVLNKDTGYVYQVEKLTILPGVLEALTKLKAAQYKLIVVTNQSGIARGYYKESDVVKVHTYMDNIFRKQNIEISGWYYCPHHPEGVIERYRKTCKCRKPEPGMLLTATKDWNIDLESSYMIGDKSSDIMAGLAAGVKTIQILAKYPSSEKAHFTASSLLESLKFIPLNNN